jgi:selenocysteine lyase/cysteine desulfurase
MNDHVRFDFENLRNEMIGADARVTTPFGERLMVYGDYTASGRCLNLVERYLQNLQRIYANTHTEDDISGRSMTNLLHEAEGHIKRSVNAGDAGRIIAIGTGATGAIDKMQQIIGVALPPGTRQKLESLLNGCFGTQQVDEFRRYIGENQPVVFVGPYEHHSNEISWRQNLATVVEVNLDAEGGIDLAHLEQLLNDSAYEGRQKIGSFSAASNVTGMRSPVHEIACLMHRNGGIACFDFAASAPYVEIDMNPRIHGYDGDPSLDAIFISPHKFLGGPGSSGILVFNESIYDRGLPPSVSAGGTVDYVGPKDQDFLRAIEDREKAGTPGVLQTLKAALAFQIKDRLTVERIEEREKVLLERAFSRWADHPGIEILGNQSPERRIGILSFNVVGTGERYLHPKFVTTLLNDLFGIQTRAGCSCAGPYGHRLLDIDDSTGQRYRHWITQGYSGIKPGWCRVSLHYVMDDLEVDYILDAVEFVADHGVKFLSLYDFDLCTGAWQHKHDPVELEKFSLEAALQCSGDRFISMSIEGRKNYYREAFRAAQFWADELDRQGGMEEVVLGGELGELQFFTLPATSLSDNSDLTAGEA